MSTYTHKQQRFMKSVSVNGTLLDSSIIYRAPGKEKKIYAYRGRSLNKFAFQGGGGSRIL